MLFKDTINLYYYKACRIDLFVNREVSLLFYRISSQFETKTGWFFWFKNASGIFMVISSNVVYQKEY